MTPYEKHSELEHKMVRYSPNGIDLIEECEDCLCRFIHNPAVGYPVSLRVTGNYLDKWIDDRKGRK